MQQLVVCHRYRRTSTVPTVGKRLGWTFERKGSWVDLSSGSTRKTTVGEPGEDREGYDSKRSRLVGGLDSSADTVGCVYFDVDICDEMNVTMLLEIIAMTSEGYQDPKNVKTKVETRQQWKSNLLPDKIVYGTKTKKILDSLKIEKGRLRELGLMSERTMYGLVKCMRWFSRACEVVA